MRRLLLLSLLWGCAKTQAGADLPPVKVAAAADLARAFPEIAAAFQKQTGRKVVFSFGSSGLLAKQMIEGAPFDIFAAANISYVDDAIKSGACLADSRTLYARGRLMVWTKKGGVAPPKAVADLADPRFTRIAIANPDHAPYGRAAKQALEKAGIWNQIAPRIVYGENIQQTLQFAQSGNVEAAIVSLSLVAGSQDAQLLPIPTDQHDPLDQGLAVCKNGAAGVEAGRKFVAYVNSPAGRTVMRKYGFLLPGEGMP